MTLTPGLHGGTCFCTIEGNRHLFQSFRALIYLLACLYFLLSPCMAHETQANHTTVKGEVCARQGHQI